jgi:RNA recognition motif-containing protein
MNIYVGNLSLEVTEDDLRGVFVTFGTVTSVALMNDQGIGSGQGRGCGYVEMPSIREGESAIEQLQGKLVKGRQLDIIKALPVTRNAFSENQGDTKVSGFSRRTGYWGGKPRRS